MLIRTIRIFIIISFLLSSPAFALETIKAPEARLPGGDNPAGETAFVPPLDRRQKAEINPDWYARTGIKKGIAGIVTTEEERFAAPDAAVLRRGFFNQWPDILTDIEEPYVFMEPDEIAGLNRTKPLLIIPSGGLYGLSDSEFFKAGLAEYVRSGGIVFCLAQQTGADFTSLPVGAGSRIEAAGWAQDHGPMFRASAVQSPHPVIINILKPLLGLETDGYFISYPAESKILLSRNDGYPTLIIYSYGSGWVIASTLFSDFSHGLGYINPDEKTLLRNILYWAKSSGKVLQSSSGAQQTFNLKITGPEQGEASVIKIMVIGPDNKPISERVIKTLIKPGQHISIPFSYTIPGDARPGIYHIEYSLLDTAEKTLSVSAETASGWFSIMQNAAAATPITRAKQALSALTIRPEVMPSIERNNDGIKLNLAITSAQDTTGQDVFVRAAGQEKSLRLTKGKTSLAFEIPSRDIGERLAYALYHSSGRALCRGSIAVPGRNEKGVMPDSPFYFPGQTARLKIYGMGKGELNLAAPGYHDTIMVSDTGEAEFTMPADLPAGIYKTEWTFQALDGSTKQGQTEINISGYRVKFLGASLEKKFEKGVINAKALFQVGSTKQISARMKLWLISPDGNTVPSAEPAVTLSPGMQEIPVPFSFKPSQAGIWEIIYAIYVAPPEGPGMSAEPLMLASGRKAFDAGSAAIIGIAADKPVYYDSSGPALITSYIFGNGKVGIETSLDGKRTAKDRVTLSGIYAYETTVQSLGPGSHNLRAAAAADKLESVKERNFTYGTRLPDLTVEVKPAEPVSASMPVSVLVSNRGKSGAGQSRVALYEGDPARGGALIGAADVPALDPGAQNVSVINWTLFKKAGKRTLYAAADADKIIVESNKNNNTASAEVKIPDLLMSVAPQKNQLSADENVSLSLLAANLTENIYKTLNVTLQIADSSGVQAASETFVIPELDPGSEQKIERTISLASMPIGAYQATAQIVKDSPLVSASAGITIIPTLSLHGALDGTPASASLCRPFTIQYRIRNAGNLPVTTGSVKIEIRSAEAGTPVFAQQLVYTEKAESIKIDRVDIPQGRYTVSLKASAVNQQHGITRDFLLAEQNLAISGPVEVKKSDGGFPRVLIWQGQADTAVEQAVAENILKQAFEQQGMYYRIAERSDDFKSQAMSGVFNAYVLFETNEMSDALDWLRDLVARGRGIVIIGESDRTRAVAEAFGFKFGEPLPDTTRMLALTEDSGLALSGTIPVSGRILPPQKKGARPAAMIASLNQPAALIDMSGKGKVILMPFSVIHSARESVASGIYGLLLRSAAHYAATETDEPGSAYAGQIMVSASTGAVKTKITETLPPGSKVIWTNIEGAVKDAGVVFELTAENEPQNVLYLYQPPAQANKKTVTEVFYECDGKFVSQGKVE